MCSAPMEYWLVRAITIASISSLGTSRASRVDGMAIAHSKYGTMLAPPAGGHAAIALPHTSGFQGEVGSASRYVICLRSMYFRAQCSSVWWRTWIASKSPVEAGAEQNSCSKMPKM
ncbi:hypothetical protein GGR57DRAFT_435066 [Xylariaceae sp. FL1272]|nr:hypothetical protein GGR57DRAFT_435066 [Xylariaceae sp. FL1272]